MNNHIGTFHNRDGSGSSEPIFRYTDPFRIAQRGHAVRDATTQIGSVLLVIGFLVFHWEGGARAASVPPGFTETIIAGPSSGNWNEAVGITFDSIGRMVVWERTGRVWFKDPGDASFTLLLDISEEVGDWQDHGFTGFALDPNFRVNGYIYLLYVVDRHHLLFFGTPSYNPNSNDYFSATIGRLTRYTCSSSNS